MILRTVLAVLVGSQLAGCSSDPSRSRDQVLSQLATAFVEQLAKGEFENASRSLGAPLTHALSAEDLRKQWDMLIEHVGGFKSTLDTGIETQDGLTAVVVNCAFERQNAKVIPWFDDQSRIVKLFYDPR